MTETKTDLISLLKHFNRKERFFLIGQALGNKDFKISDEFREIISKKLNIDIPIDAFAAMDYHLDWIYASLYCAEKGTTEFITDNPLGLNANQEDVDFIIAFKKDEIYHLILIEAKAESGWTNKQISSKAKKLKTIFGSEKCIWDNVNPYLLLTSPRMPARLHLDVLPGYILKTIEQIWFELRIPNNLYKITRCNEAGKASKSSTYWTVDPKRNIGSNNLN